MALSASDLFYFLEWENLPWLALERLHHRVEAAPKRPDSTGVVTRKGDEHERRHLTALRERWGSALVELDARRGSEELVRAVEQTEAAMRAGAPAIFQATFLHKGWVGHADFLERVDHIDRPASRLGAWSYEVLDTKLARAVKPYFVIQL